MKYLVMSDTHGNTAAALKILAGYPDADAVIHLGDGTEDLRPAERFFSGAFICVRGNNDWCSSPEERTVEIGGVKFFLSHGHRYGVRYSREMLASEAKRNGCLYALYGHTHVARDENIYGVRLLNPGAVSFPVGESGIILIDSEPVLTVTRIPLGPGGI